MKVLAAFLIAFCTFQAVSAKPEPFIKFDINLNIFSDLINKVKGLVENVVGEVNKFVGETINHIKGLVGHLSGELQKFVNTAGERISEATKALEQEVAKIKDDVLKPALDKVVVSAKKAVAEVEGALKEVAAHAETLFEKLKTDIQEVVSKMSNKITDLSKDLTDKLKEAAEKKSKKAKECTEKYGPQIKEFGIKNVKGLEQCAIATKDSAEKLIKEKAEDLLKVPEVITDLYHSIDACLKESPVEAVGCVAKAGIEVVGKCKGLVSSVVSIKSELEKTLITLGHELGECAAGVVAKATSEAATLGVDIAKCVA